MLARKPSDAQFIWRENKTDKDKHLENLQEMSVVTKCRAMRGQVHSRHAIGNLIFGVAKRTGLVVNASTMLRIPTMWDSIYR